MILIYKYILIAYFYKNKTRNHYKCASINTNGALTFLIFETLYFQDGLNQLNKL